MLFLQRYAITNALARGLTACLIHSTIYWTHPMFEDWRAHPRYDLKVHPKKSGRSTKEHVLVTPCDSRFPSHDHVVTIMVISRVCISVRIRVSWLSRWFIRNSIQPVDDIFLPLPVQVTLRHLSSSAYPVTHPGNPSTLPPNQRQCSPNAKLHQRSVAPSVSDSDSSRLER